jgi:GntR family transcriptional regulator
LTRTTIPDTVVIDSPASDRTRRRGTEELVARIEQYVRHEGLTPGERVGSERELADHFGVPRTALRVALAQLESRQLVRRTIGRTGGVFADDGKIERQLNTIQGVPSMLRQQGIVCRTDVLRSEIGLAEPHEARALGLTTTERVYRIVRKRYADEEPWSLDTSVIPAALAPALGSYDLTGSLYGILAERFGAHPREADETIDTVPATLEQAQLLGVGGGDPLFQIRRITWNQDGTPMELARDLFRADRTRIHLRRYGVSWMRARRVATA